MTYSLPNITNASTQVDLLVWANNTVGGFFGIGIFVLIFMISFMIYSRQTTVSNALATAMWQTSILSIFLYSMNLLPDVFMFIPALAGLIGIAWLTYNK